MQESEFTGCVNKVQGKPQNRVKIPGRSGAAYCATPVRTIQILERIQQTRTGTFARALTPLAASCTMKWIRALSSVVRAFGLHPKGRPFKSDSAHHRYKTPCSADVVELVGTPVYLSRSLAYLAGTARFEPPKSLSTAKLMPITFPFRLKSGPPEPPEVVAASYTILSSSTSPM
jgi:hypothetical protein